jgi:arabinose-5-phosphate isomerase
MLVLGDALAMVLLEARGFDKEDFARYHPAGRLGRALLLKVHQIMRGEDQLAKVLPDTPLVEVIRRMTSRRAGAAVVVNASGTWKVSSRTAICPYFPNTPDIEGAVGDFMTRNPVTISDDQLAAEVLRVLQMHRIDDIIVVDGAQHPIGIVDSQDLSRLKIL